MIAKVKFIDGEIRTYPRVRRTRFVGDFVVLVRWGRRKVAVAGREVKWIQVGREKKLYQKDFSSSIAQSL